MIPTWVYRRPLRTGYPKNMPWRIGTACPWSRPTIDQRCIWRFNRRVEELPQPEQSGNDAAPVDDPVVLAVVQPIEAEVVDEPVRESARVPDQDQPLPEPVGMLAAEETRLLLNYTGDCWTEITDASGRRLFFDMGHNGRTVELTGQAPFNVLFGNFENVSVSVDGTNFPISASNPGSRTARLTILNQ